MSGKQRCEFCDDTGWVCENHPERPWGRMSNRMMLARAAVVLRAMPAIAVTRLTFRIEGADFVTTVDVSWNEAWTGTEQRRRFSFVEDKLFIESAPQPSTLFPGKTVVGRLVWERDSVGDGVRSSVALC
jgi:lipocalin-like protein